MSPSIKYLLSQHEEAAEKIKRYLNKSRKDIETKRAELQELEMFGHYNSDLVTSFFEKPYVTLPRGTGEEWYLIVPKFFEMNVGYLTKSTDSYNVFIVNKYAHYLGAVPEEFQKIFKFKTPIPLKMFDGVLLTGDDHQDTAFQRYRKFLTSRKGKDKIKIKSGSQFDLIAALIDDGILPFMPKPVDKSHFIEAVWKEEVPEIERRRQMAFFQDAISRFYETGAVGLYWAMGVGKTLYGLEALASVRVGDLPNLVISGKSAALREQWTKQLKLIEPAAKVEVYTYLSAHKVIGRKWGLVIFDEAHHLPAKTFSKLSTIDAEYRIGLSATPYREDKKTQYIFALTGFPIGLDWRVLIELGLIKAPDVTLFLCKDYSEKKAKLGELLQHPEKTLIYCFYLEVGHDLSKTFEIPFVHSATPVKDRLEIVDQSQVSIISSVGKEGLSFRDIERTITYNFLYGSRQEETQFTGRGEGFHGKKKEKKAHSHFILMTDEEYELYGKRLYGLQEKGFKIQVQRAGGGSAPIPTSTKTRTRRTPRATTPRPKPVKMQKTKPVVDTSKFPLLKELDDRDDFDKHYEKMVFAILRSEFAKSGLEVGTIRQILEFHNIKFTYRRLRDRMTSLYKSRKIGSRKNLDGKRIYFME